METTCFQHKEFLFAGPLEQFDIHKKLPKVCKVGLTTPPPPHYLRCNCIIDCVTKCIAQCFYDFSTIALTFSLIFMNIQIKNKKIICISDHVIKGLYISFTLVSSLVVKDK